MHSFLINLDRSPDRLAFFTAQTEAAGIEFERVRAIDGRELTQQQQDAVNSRSFEFQPTNAGYTALFMTHRLIWQEIIDREMRHAAVFEDDAVLSAKIHESFRALDDEQLEFDIIKLETTSRKVVCSRDAFALRSGDTLQTLLSWHGGTAGYVVSARGARRLLALKEQLSDVIDQVMFNPLSSVCSQLNVLQMNPAACIQKDILDKASSDAFGTTIDREKSKKRLFRYGLVADARRLIKRQFEASRRRALARQPQNIQSVIPFGSRVTVPSKVARQAA